MANRTILGARAIAVILGLAVAPVSADWDDDYYDCLAGSSAEDGVGSCNKALQNSEISVAERAGILRALAGHQRRAGDTEDARATLELAVNLNPADASALVEIGDIYYSAANYMKARDAYTRALSLNRASVEALNNRAITQAALGEVDAAFEDFRLALSLMPTNGDIWNNRANLNCSNGRFAEALQDRTQALYTGRFTAGAAQAGLRKSGHYSGPADGIWGTDSEEALKAWTDDGCPDAPRTRLL